MKGRVLGFLSTVLPQVSSNFTKESKLTAGDSDTSEKFTAAPWVAGISFSTLGLVVESIFLKYLWNCSKMNFRDMVKSHFRNTFFSLIPAVTTGGGLWFLTGMDADEAALIALGILAFNHTLAELGLLFSARHKLAEHEAAMAGAYFSSMEVQLNPIPDKSINKDAKKTYHFSAEFEASLAKRIKNSTQIKLVVLYVTGAVMGYVNDEISNKIPVASSPLRPFQTALAVPITLNGIWNMVVHGCVAKRRSPEDEKIQPQKRTCPALCLGTSE